MKLIRVLSALGVFICFVLWVSSALAARNASGTYSKLYTFSPGTVINSTNVNSQFSDMESALTDSLDRNGKGGMLAALRGTDGTVTAPAFAFTSETGTGLYRIGSSNPGFSVNQAKVGEWTANGYLSANGAVATPSLSFSNDTGSGLYRVSSNDLGFAVNGVRLTEWNASGFAVGAAPISKYPFDVQKISGANHARFGSYLTLMGSAPQLGFNLYNDGSNKYMNTAIAGYLSFDLTNYFIFYTAPSGSADAAATITERMRINTSGVTVANDLTVSGNMTLTGSIAALKIGSAGTSSTQLNFGSCTLNGASPSQCTATVVAGAKCVASTVGSTNDSAAASVSVTTTTLTVTKENGSTKVVNYICF